MAVPKILAFAGSTRADSFNHRLLALASSIARDAGAKVTEIDLADFPLPLYHQDLEANEGLPDSAVRLKQLFLEHTGLLLACPEYNSSITPLWKNTIDWVSRRATADEPPLSAYQGKIAALLAASPGALGGLRGLRHVREILSNIGVLVVPQQFALAQANKAFDEAANLTDPKQREMVKSCVETFVQYAAKHV